MPYVVTFLSCHVSILEWIHSESIVAWMSKNSLLETSAISKVKMIAMGLKPTSA